LGFTVRGYVQEPTKDTIPVRELFPRRICLRVAAKSHVSMVLGDQAYDRGAWANRITDAEAGVGYVVGEGIREPLRIAPAGSPTKRSNTSKPSSPPQPLTPWQCCRFPPIPPTPTDRIGEVRLDDHL
jgi:hypothetical protein